MQQQRVQGPIVIHVNPSITVAELKVQVEKEFEIPVDVQKWILGKQLVGEDTTTLQSQGITADGDEIYLYLVNPGEKKEEKPDSPVSNQATATQKIPLLLPTEPNQKGRYWNYEMERWSFCNSDDDDDRAEEVKQMNGDNNNNIAGDGEDEEWEYYYDDVDLKPAEAAPKQEAGEAAVEPQPGPSGQQEAVAAQPARPAQPAQPAQPTQVQKKVDGWECPVCTLVNPMARPGCMACTTERPAHLGAAAAAEAGAKEEAKPKEEQKASLDMYKQLENLDIIPNAENFECTICYLDVEPGDGVVLRECLHTFCK